MNAKANKGAWVSAPGFSRIQNDSLIESLQNELLQTVLAVIQDGICILDNELNIVYVNPAMRSWYPGVADVSGLKCYKAYHNLEAPCEVCPTLRAFESNMPQTDVVRYTGENGDEGWQQLYCAPLLSARDGNAILVIEYIRDITLQKRAELATELAESQNMTLLNFLEQKQKEKETLEKTISANIERCIMPVLNYLDKILGKDSTDIIRRQLDLSIQGLAQSKSDIISILSPRELQIATLIRDNMISKEIADKLVISKKAVDYHRTNIRKKLGLKADDNLQSFLERNM